MKAFVPGRAWTVLLALAVPVAASCLSAGGRERPAARDAPSNSVARYLTDAELQLETGEQKLEIEHALRDMLELGPDQLRDRRYADYQGHPARWSVTMLLQRYFVPATPADLEESRFYRDVAGPEARAAVRRALAAVEVSVPAH